jgi:hypothetical protein
VSEPTTTEPARARGRLARWPRAPLDFWFEPIAQARFLLWQRAFALTFIIFVAQWAYYGAEWLTDVGYHTSAEATDTVYPAPFPLLPSWGLAPFLGVMFGSALLVTLDLGGRLAKLTCFACAVYIQLADQISSFTLNKLYIYGFFLITFAPRPQRDPSAPDAWLLSAWPVRVIQTTLLIQYAEAGWCKLHHGDWLHVVDILYGHSVGVYRTEVAGWLMNHMPPLFWSASSLFAVSFEALAPLIFIPRRTRWFAILSGTAMHLVIAVLMKDLIFFSLQMITFYIVFLDDGLCTRIETWLQALIRRAKLAPSGRRPASGSAPG